MNKEDLKARTKRFALRIMRLVEALPKIAYEHAHLPGAINLPSDQVSVLAPKLLPDKNADIVVYCASPT